MRPRSAVLAVSFFLLSFGCASTTPAVRAETASASASRTANAASPPGAEVRPLRAERLDIPTFPGKGTIQRTADGTHILVTEPGPAIVRVALEPADVTPEVRARREAEALTARGVRIGAIDVASNGAYASFDWEGDLGSGQRRGRFAVRRPTERPGSLVVMSGYWPTAATGQVSEQIGLMFLLTSAR